MLVLGVILSTAILIGALIVGDSVRYSLKQIVHYRLGSTNQVIVSQNRFFNAAIAEKMSEELKTDFTPVIMIKGMAISNGGRKRINDVQVLGVDGRFGKSPGISSPYLKIGDQEILLNQPLAEAMNLKEGDDVLIRFELPNEIPVQNSLDLDQKKTLARSFKIKRVVNREELGNFNLKANQADQKTAFISLEYLSETLGFEGKANVLLVSERPDSPISINDLKKSFSKCWELSDAGLKTHLLADGSIELKSDRIFIDRAIEDTFDNLKLKSGKTLTYFVNRFDFNNKSTPYSFISAPGFPLVPENLKKSQIIINQWLAEDLGIGIGDDLTVYFFHIDKNGLLTEKSSKFKVIKIFPMKSPYIDLDLMPEFPGLTEKSSCREWDTGIPVDFDKIRDKDEKYWEDYRGLPKAYVSLEAAQKLWENKFGRITSLRFSGILETRLSEQLLTSLNPSKLGFAFLDVGSSGHSAVSKSIDFGMLFVSLSFFVILSALLLTGLMFTLNLEKRSKEKGLLLALGIPHKIIKKTFYYEAVILIVIGTGLGVLLGIVYNYLILFLLKTIWIGIVGTTALEIHLKGVTILIGIVASAGTAVLSVFLLTRKAMKKSIHSLQRGYAKLSFKQFKKPIASYTILLVGLLSVFAGLFSGGFTSSSSNFIFFFSAGIIFLICGVAFLNLVIYRKRKNNRSSVSSMFDLSFSGILKNSSRNIVLIIILASAMFIIFAVGANQKDALINSEKRSSGTGGFTFFAQSTIPLFHDLNTKAGISKFGLEDLESQKIRFVHFKFKEGDDASCLNLNMVSNPSLIGVKTNDLSSRKSFSFSAGTVDLNKDNPWPSLDQLLPDGSIPAIADQTVILWGLGKSVGDFLTYQDESGKTFKLKLIGGLNGSIFQGSILISDKFLKNKYPSIEGSRIHLIDAPLKESGSVKQRMQRVFEDYGLTVELSTDRLARFNKISNIYLMIFMVLGSLGLIIGTIGVGIVILRKVEERKSELALFKAIGFGKKQIQKLIVFEHMIVFFYGIFLGLISAIVSSLPSMINSSEQIPLVTITVLLVLVFLNGFFWIRFASRMALRGDIVSVLKND